MRESHPGCRDGVFAADSCFLNRSGLAAARAAAVPCCGAAVPCCGTAECAADVPNRFSSGGSYTTPGLRSGTGLVGRLTGGWTLGVTLTLQSGTPLFIFTGASYALQRINPSLPVSPTNLEYLPGSGDFSASGYNYALPNVNAHATMLHTRNAYKSNGTGGAFPGCQNFLSTCTDFAVPTFGQLGNEQPNGQFRNPGFAQTDASLKKNTKIAERFDLDLRLDAFNVLNQVNFYGLDANLQDGSLGSTGSTHTPRYL